MILHGSLPYEAMEKVLKDAFVFVGMGTALLEAAACGVPAIVAIESCPRAATYGLFHETAGRHLGYADPNAPEFSFREKIEHLSQLSADEYENVSHQTVGCASQYAMEGVMQQFLRSLEEIEPFSYQITTTMKLKDFLDRCTWRVLKCLGFKDPYKDRYLPKNERSSRMPTSPVRSMTLW